MITREPYPYRLTVPVLEEAVEDGRVERGVVGPERGGKEVGVRQEVLVRVRVRVRVRVSSSDSCTSACAEPVRMSA